MSEHPAELVASLNRRAATERVLREVLEERSTHDGRGWTAEHDLTHGVDHLVVLANKYAHKSGPPPKLGGFYDRTNLVKAAALLVAAIELLDVVERDGRF